jgi:hypothetical protein
MYRDLAPEAYADGYSYGRNGGKGKGERFADGYTGAEIRRADEETPKSVAYSAYCDGYCEGVRDRAKALGAPFEEVLRGR